MKESDTECDDMSQTRINGEIYASDEENLELARISCLPLDSQGPQVRNSRVVEIFNVRVSEFVALWAYAVGTRWPCP